MIANGYQTFEVRENFINLHIEHESNKKETLFKKFYELNHLQQELFQMINFRSCGLLRNLSIKHELNDFDQEML